MSASLAVICIQEEGERNLVGKPAIKTTTSRGAKLSTCSAISPGEGVLWFRSKFVAFSQGSDTNCSAPIDANPSKNDVGWSIDMMWA